MHRCTCNYKVIHVTVQINEKKSLPSVLLNMGLRWENHIHHTVYLNFKMPLTSKTNTLYSMLVSLKSFMR